MAKLILFVMLFFALAPFVMADSDCLAPYMHFTEQWEGKRHKVYICPAGFKTVGVGHRLQKDESYLFASDKKILDLYREDMSRAYLSAQKIVSDFDSLPLEVRLVVVDMVFNMGETGFKRFQKAICACNAHNFAQMAKELKDSKWYGQTGRRSLHHFKTISKVSSF